MGGLISGVDMYYKTYFGTIQSGQNNTGDCRMFATGLEMHQIVEVPNANFLALLFKSGQLFLMRSKHCDYSVVTMAIIGKAVSFSVLLQTLCNLQS